MKQLTFRQIPFRFVKYVSLILILVCFTSWVISASSTKSSSVLLGHNSPSASLLTLTVDNTGGSGQTSDVELGAIVTFTIQIHNESNAEISGIQIFNTFPANGAFVYKSDSCTELCDPIHRDSNSSIPTKPAPGTPVPGPSNPTPTPTPELDGAVIGLKWTKDVSLPANQTITRIFSVKIIGQSDGATFSNLGFGYLQNHSITRLVLVRSLSFLCYLSPHE